MGRLIGDWWEEDFKTQGLSSHASSFFAVVVVVVEVPLPLHPCK
jgi:hypothetical protein